MASTRELRKLDSDPKIEIPKAKKRRMSLIKLAGSRADETKVACFQYKPLPVAQLLQYRSTNSTAEAAGNASASSLNPAAQAFVPVHVDASAQGAWCEFPTPDSVDLLAARVESIERVLGELVPSTSLKHFNVGASGQLEAPEIDRTVACYRCKVDKESDSDSCWCFELACLNAKL